LFDVSLARHGVRHPIRRARRRPPYRRHVAVLFADLTGFTRLVESSDPEQVYATVRPLLDELVLLVHLHGGEVQQVLGDGFMCVFGLRETRGDEAGRAVACGLAMIEAGRGALPVHVGLEYGEVLVTPTWEPAGFGVWGRAVNHAQRLCDLAGPGELNIGPAASALVPTMRAATHVLADLAGVAGPLPVQRLRVPAAACTA
jgi:class 3 adenylate cyclase